MPGTGRQSLDAHSRTAALRVTIVGSHAGGESRYTVIKCCLSVHSPRACPSLLPNHSRDMARPSLWIQMESEQAVGTHCLVLSRGSCHLKQNALCEWSDTIMSLTGMTIGGARYSSNAARGDGSGAQRCPRAGAFAGGEPRGNPRSWIAQHPRAPRGLCRQQEGAEAACVRACSRPSGGGVGLVPHRLARGRLTRRVTFAPLARLACRSRDVPEADGADEDAQVHDAQVLRADRRGAAARGAAPRAGPITSNVAIACTQEGLQQGSGWRGMLPGVKKSVRAATMLGAAPGAHRRRDRP